MMLQEPYKVSILIPVYGVEKYIERCARSIFEQTYDNLDIIFVDDCSKDKSIEILEKTLQKYPQRQNQTRIIKHSSNKGLSGSRNTAVDAAEGVFLVHVDSDDFVAKDLIFKLVEKQVETDADIVSCFICKIKAEKKVVYTFPNNSSPEMLNIASITHSVPNNIWGRLIRKNIYTENGISVMKGVNMSEDLNVLPRLLYFSRKVATVEECLHFYDCSNQSSYTSAFSEDRALQSWKTLDMLNDFFANEPRYKEALKIRMMKVLWNHIKKCGCYDGHKDFFVLLKKRLKEMEPRYWNTLDLKIRFLLRIDNYFLFSLCMKILRRGR